jgi:hypothetical protein
VDIREIFRYRLVQSFFGQEVNFFGIKVEDRPIIFRNVFDLAYFSQGAISVVDSYNLPTWFRKYCISRINEINKKREENKSDKNVYTPMPKKKGELIDGRFIDQYLRKNTSQTIEKKQDKQFEIKTPFSSTGKRPNIPLPTDK